VGSYDNGGKQVAYNPVPALGPGYNSNSFNLYHSSLMFGLSIISAQLASPWWWGYVVPGFINETTRCLLIIVMILSAGCSGFWSERRS